MSPAYDEIVASIDPTKHEMKWSFSLGLPPDPSTGANIWWTIHLQFLTWKQTLYEGTDAEETYGFDEGITFISQENLEDPTEVPEVDVPRAVIDRCIDFFENE